MADETIPLESNVWGSEWDLTPSPEGGDDFPETTDEAMSLDSSIWGSEWDLTSSSEGGDDSSETTDDFPDTTDEANPLQSHVWGPEWDLTPSPEGNDDWHSHAADFPEIPDLVKENHSSDNKSSDSGYGSDSEANKYECLSFRERHYFHTYVQRILEETCFRYAQENLTAQLGDLEWKKKNLMLGYGDFPDDKLVYRDWLGEDQMELQGWIQMLILFSNETEKSKDAGIFNCAVHLRNATVHRGNCHEGGELTFQRLKLALQLPNRLGDARSTLEADNAFRYIVEDPTLDETTKASVKQTIYATPPCTTRYRLLSRIQTLLEDSCFRFAKRKVPEALTTKGWEMAEQVELPEWTDFYRTHWLQHDDSANGIFPSMDSSSLLSLLHTARRDIRNVVAHRLPISDERVVQEIQTAIRICILQSDWQQAIEIEVLAEIYYTASSRAQVLTRLGSVYRVGRPGSAYEGGRRVAIKEFLDKEGYETEAGDEGFSGEDINDLGMGEDGRSWAQRTWSPSMHALLKREEVLLVGDSWEE